MFDKSVFFIRSTWSLIPFITSLKSQVILVDFALFLAGYYMIPLSCASFLGTLIFGPMFDSIGRRPMLLVTCTTFIFRWRHFDASIPYNLFILLTSLVTHFIMFLDTLFLTRHLRS